MEYPIEIITLGKLRIVRVDSYNYSLEELKPVQIKDTDKSRDEWVIRGWYGMMRNALIAMKEEAICLKLSESVNSLPLEGLCKEVDEELIKVLKMEEQ